MPPSDQCAVGPDGKLLDQRAIVWYNDPEDSTPIAVATPTLPSSALKATTLRTFFKDGTTPSSANAILDSASGTRHSSRVSKPSKRVLDANNMGLTEMPKRVRVAHNRVVESEMEDEGEEEEDNNNNNNKDDLAVTTHASDGGGDTDVEMEDMVAAESAYASTKVMGDQDRKVSTLLFVLTLGAQFM